MTVIFRNALLGFMLFFVSASSFSQFEPAYKSLAEQKTWSQTATSNEVKELYGMLLADLAKQNPSLQFSVDSELELVNNLTPRQLETFALAIVAKYNQIHFATEYEEEVRAQLSVPWVKALFAKTEPGYELISNDTEQQIALCAPIKLCTYFSCITAYGLGGTFAGAALGLFGGYLLYTFGFLIASGIAGPLDDIYYSWEAILASFGTGSAVGSFIGGCIGSCVGFFHGCLVTNHREKPNQGLLPGSQVLSHVLTFEPIALP